MLYAVNLLPTHQPQLLSWGGFAVPEQALGQTGRFGVFLGFVVKLFIAVEMLM